MMVAAPASFDPATAAHPTPPQPKTATESPSPTCPVNMAAPRPAMTPQPSRPTASGRAAGLTLVHWPAATSVLSAKAPMPSAAESGGAVGQGHLLGGVVGREAVPGPSPAARPALAAHGPPVEDDEVARRQVGDARPDGLDEPGGLVPEEEGEVVVDAALAVVQVGVADAAGLDGDHRLARSRVGYDDRLERDRCTLPHRDHTRALLVPCPLLRSASPHDARWASGTAKNGPRRSEPAVLS